MKRWLIGCAVLAICASPPRLSAQDGGVPVGPDPTSVRRAVNSITADDVLARVGVLAHDSMRGRNTPSPELDEVAAWIGEAFRSNGLRPGGDAGSFVQRYPIRTTRLDLSRSAVAVEGGPTWQVGTDVARHLGGAAPSGVTGPTVVLTGSGDTSALRGVSLDGAIVLAIAPTIRSLNEILNFVLEHHPAAILFVTDRSGQSWARLLQRNQQEERLSRGWSSSRTPPVLEVRDETVARTLAAHGINLRAVRRRPNAALKATPLPGLHLTVTIRNALLHEEGAPNVVGILEGSDPVLRNEYVVFSAHMDHVGVGSPVRGDSIYNGADDDASGTAAVMEVAEAFAQLKPRPRRSLIFLTVSGEEKGLWGSEYFATNPPVPIERIVADLNVDMVGRNWTDTIVAIGKQHSDLGASLDRVAAAHPELHMTPIDDLWPQERFYFRSDHYNFAKRGVPILFFFNGTHRDYHRPSDQVELIDADKESRIVKLIFYLGLDVANREQRPQWNPDSYRRIVETGTR